MAERRVNRRERERERKREKGREIERKVGVELATPTPYGVALRPAAPRDAGFVICVLVFTTAHVDAYTFYGYTYI